jgi:lambda family phage tail tape measure protein
MNLFGKGKEDTGELKLSKDTLDAIGLQLYKQEQDRKKAAQTEKELADLTYQQGLNHFNNNLQLEDQQRNTEQLRNLFADIVLLNNVLSTEGAMKQLAAQNELIGLYGREYEYKQELLAIDAERQNTIDQINQNLILMGDAVQQSDIARAEREIELAQYVADERLRIFLDGLEKQKAAEENVPSTLNRFFDDLARSANPAIVALNKADSVLNNMRTSLDEFATTGKFKFKNFALSVIRDLLMVEAQAKLTLLFSSIGKAFMGALNPAAIPIPGKAMGGPVTGNSPYVVGEKGPELFIPKSSGTIIPNDKMSGNQSSGGPVTNVYNNYSISAIDSQSVAQFFAQNRKMALGAVTMAQKELSYGS